MKRTDVSIEYNNKKFSVSVEYNGLESQEELEVKAQNVLDRIFSSVAVRQHIFKEED